MNPPLGALPTAPPPARNLRNKFELRLTGIGRGAGDELGFEWVGAGGADRGIAGIGIVIGPGADGVLAADDPFGNGAGTKAGAGLRYLAPTDPGVGSDGFFTWPLAIGTARSGSSVAYLACPPGEATSGPGLYDSLLSIVA